MWERRGYRVCVVQLQVARWCTRAMGVMLMCMLVVNRGTLPLCLFLSVPLTQWGPSPWQRIHIQFKGPRHCEQDVGSVAHVEGVLASRIWSTSRINACPRVNGPWMQAHTNDGGVFVHADIFIHSWCGRTAGTQSAGYCRYWDEVKRHVILDYYCNLYVAVQTRRRGKRVCERVCFANSWRFTWTRVRDSIVLRL